MDITFSVFVATSLDGFVARRDGKLDWLEDAAVKGDTEDYGYQNFIIGVDAIVMGRGTFEKVATFAQWPYEGKKVYVISNSMVAEPPEFSDKITLFKGELGMLAVEMQHQGMRRIYIDGASTIQSCLRAGLIDEVIVTQIPVLIGNGMSLFGNLQEDVKLKLTQSKSYPSGFVQSRYRVIRKTKNYAQDQR